MNGVGKYYLYRHIREDKNIPFYIGIGQNFSNPNDFRRAFEKHSSNRIWNYITSKTNYIVEIIYTSFTREEICNKEKEFILLYGRIDLKTGTLANLTNGGEKHLGLSEVTKKKLRNRMIGNKYMVGRKLSDETKLKMSLSGKGRKISELAIRILQERNKGNKYGEKLKGRKLSIEHRSKLSIIRKGKPTFQSFTFLCINNNKIYKSIVSCVIDLFDGNKSAQTGVSRALNGKTKGYKNFYFKKL